MRLAAGLASLLVVTLGLSASGQPIAEQPPIVHEFFQVPML
jgi:hypothetical protein